MRRDIVGLLLIALAVPGSAWAQSASSSDATMPDHAFFVGAGAGYSFTNFGSQSVYNKGISNVFLNGSQVANGQASGPPVQTFLGGNQSNPAPEVQLGYFRHFANSDWLWGGKASYAYVGSTSSVQNLVIPQFGSSSNGGVSSFNGYSVTGSYSVTLGHQMSLMPFVGRSFGKGFFYAGAGPSLSQVQASLNNVVGYATINGKLTDVSGPPQSFSSTNWLIGFAATAGVTYFLTPSWFMDLSYGYSQPGGRTSYINSPFYNPGTGGVSFSGNLIGYYTANVSSHMIALTFNKSF